MRAETLEDGLTPGWRAVAVVAEGQAVQLGGFDVWSRSWTPAAEPAIVVAHPGYPLQRHRASRYVLSVAGEDIRFAACELSPNCWGFYVPD